MKLTLSNTTYCGIKYGHNRWIRHLYICLICKREHEKQKQKTIDDWSTKCKCGCGKITNVGNIFIAGHNTKDIKWSDKRKLLMSEKFSGKGNPMYNVPAWSKGKTKYNDDSLMSMSKKMSIKVKREYDQGLRNISGENNPMFEKEPWNYGLTKYDDDRIKLYGEKISINKKQLWKNMSEHEKQKIRERMAYIGSRCKKKDTKIEIKIREFLEKNDILYKQNHLMGRYSVDFYLLDFNLVIECNGDYWHANPKKYKMDNINEVQQNNIKRDKRKQIFLDENKINYVFLWEYDIHHNFELVKNEINKMLKR